MMEYKLIKSPSNGIWVFIDGKHKKTIPAKFQDDFAKACEKLDFDKKRLFSWERKIFEDLNRNEKVNDFKHSLKSTDLHLFRAIENCNAVGVRFVNSKNGNRFEMKFDNGMYVKIPKGLFFMYPEKLPEAFLNY